MIWIISGPTSVGKSTFIASARSAELTGLPAGTPVVWPATDSRLDQPDLIDAFYHYNILRPRQQNRRRARLAVKSGEKVEPSANEFAQDSLWTDLVGRAATKKAVVLVANTRTIVERMRQRDIIEEPELRGQTAKDYPIEKWLSLIEEVDLPALYRTWRQELRASNIPYVLVDSTDDRYRVIEAEECLEEILKSGKPANTGVRAAPGPAAAEGGGSAYSEEQIAKLLRERRFGYHRVELPYGLRTRGQDRSETRDLVLPESLAGKSVLDVGSAHGYFCFEAEARGAMRVLGVELREDRFRDALLLKEIKGSNVEFIQRDIVLDPLDEQFDCVLLLNVVHHLNEPVRAIRQLASITRERLVIEFPTLADRKFHQSLETELPAGYDKLPLIGVSSMLKDVDQTFVFTPSAMRRILLDHEPLCDEVEIVDSPMPGRAIAICHMSESQSEPPSDLHRRQARRREGPREKDRRRPAVGGD